MSLAISDLEAGCRDLNPVRERVQQPDIFPYRKTPKIADFRHP